MEDNRLVLAYPESDIKVKSVFHNEEIYFCLTDITKLLASQNVTLAEGKKPEGLGQLISAQLEVLEPDELSNFSDEPYVTQPGLFRIILRDNSRACKQFQRWVLHEVLPSIQKYGTYPPPLVGQDSDVKRIVESLLLEIVQREKLEKETKETFNKHEKMLNALGNRLDIIGDSGNQSYFSVEDYCKEQYVEDTSEHIIFGWCLKICAEGPEPSGKRMIDNEEVKTFPLHVLVKAHREARKGRG